MQAAIAVALGSMGLVGRPPHLVLATLWGGWRLELGMDGLSGFFLAVLGLVLVTTAVYGERYIQHYGGRQRVLIRALVPQFALAMALLLVSRDAITFLTAWEWMALVSFGLVMVEHRRAQVRRAGFVYLAATHSGALALIALFALLAAHGLGIGFRSYAQGVPHLGIGLRSVLLLVGLVGFGSKAAIVPLHVWLPRAHPVAPSHVSALMSGVMIKVAIYGLIRLVFGWLGVGPLWWGVLLLGVGAASALLGVLYALMEHGLKRLLAYHSVENIGIIVLGLGAAELGRSLGADAVFAFAFAAALFHVLNHAVFKSGLFLAAGAVRFATGTDDLEHLGGLARAMPWTSGAFILLAMAIVGLPPFNGFASEWMTLQSLLRVSHLAAPLVALAALSGALGLALTGGLAAACFVKAAGVGFLGPARHHAAALAEVPWPMVFGPALLAGLSLLLGFVPGGVAAIGMQIARELTQAALPAGPGALALSAPWTQPQWPLYLALGSTGAVLLLSFALSRPAAAAAIRPRWGCGGEVGPSSAFTATSYSKLIRQIFAPLYQPARSVVRTAGELPHVPSEVRYTSTVRHVIDQRLYLPLQREGLRLAQFLRRLQSGSLRQYIAYMFVTLLLVLAAVGRR